MKLRKLLSAYKTKLLGQPAGTEVAEIAGRTLTVARGTMPARTDRDAAWWYALCRHYNMIYDIGSNVGYSSILACLHRPDRHILLADPNPAALKAANENMVRNNMNINKLYVNSFVSDKKGQEVKFYSIGTGSAGSMYGSHAESARAVNAHYMVPTTTVDELVKETGQVPDLVKIDVEAAESFVLNGSVQLAEKQHAVFFVEMHGPQEMPMLKNAGLVLEWCKKANYTAWYLKEHTELTDAKQIAHRGRCHLLLLPNGMAYPDYLKGIEEGDGV